MPNSAAFSGAFLRVHVDVPALDAGVIVGFASGVHYVHPDKPAELWINEVGVAPTHQRQGIGRRLIAETRRLGGKANMILLAAPKAREYYPRIGMTQHPSAWTLGPDQPLD